MRFRSWLFLLRADIRDFRSHKQQRRSAVSTVIAAETDLLESRCLLSSISLVEGVDGYAGTVDTWIDGGKPDTNFGSSSSLEIDGDSGVEQSLLRFDQIFGDGAGQIPQSSTIQSATLEIEVTNSGDDPNLYRVLTNWTETDTWNSLDGGLLTGSDVAAVPEVSVEESTGTVSIDVTASLQLWANDPTTNQGWAFLSTGNNGVHFSSSEAGTVSDRPRLNVTFATDGPPPTNSAPVAQDDSASTSTSAAVTIDVLSNDSDADGNTISIDQIASPTADGQLSVNANGTVTYTPDAEFSGSDSFTYTVTDGSLSSNAATVTITVGLSTTSSVYQDGFDGYSGTVDTWVDGRKSDVNFGANDTLEIDGDSGVEQTLLRFEEIFGNSDGQIAQGSTIQSATLEVNVTNTGSDPNLHRVLTDWSEADTWDSLVDGLQIGTDVVSTPEASVQDSSGVVSIDVTASLQSWSIDPTINLGWAFLPTGTNGLHLSSSESGTVSERPRLSVIHSVGGPPPANSAPVAQDDAASTPTSTAVSISVLSNDTDVDGDPISVDQIVSGPSSGQLTVNAGGTISYLPNEDFTGTDSFTYTATDGLLSSAAATVTVVVTPPEPLSLPAFPGAEGFGTETIGGRGGVVIKVTNTNDSGAGSLRDALENVSGPRIVVFDTGGLITLSESIRITDPYVTIAGQTAPGDGIAIRSAPLVVATHDVIIRNLRFRVGDLADGSDPTSRDGITISTSGGNSDVYNVVVDHSSVAWGVDENVSTWSSSNNGFITHDVTIQRSITGEALNDSIHVDEGTSGTAPHSMGALLGRDGYNISFHHNLLAHNHDRNPRISGIIGAEVVNNVIYNWGDGPAKISGDENVVHVINNYFKPGQDSAERDIQLSSGSIDPGTRLYVSGNYVDPVPGETRTLDSNEARDTDSENDVVVRYAPGWSDPVPPSFRALTPQFTSPLATVDSALVAYSNVLADVGATLPFHDSVDARLLSEVQNRTGGIIDSQNERGGWQLYELGTPLPDSDGDGMPDTWEADNGTDPTVDDSAFDINDDGYSNIENYINGLFDSDSGDTAGPEASLTAPVDNGADDLDLSIGSVQVNQTLPNFQISLSDVSGTIHDASVTAGTVVLTRDGTTLQEGIDYTFNYDAGSDVITLASVGGNFGDGQYEISINNGAEQITDVLGNAMDATTLNIEIDTTI